MRLFYCSGRYGCEGCEGVIEKRRNEKMHRILIVDDEAVEREVIRFLLQAKAYSLEISEAVNGREGIALLSEMKYDILLTDIKMPFIDGIELAKRARKLYPDIYIIFFSGYQDFVYAKEAICLQAANYILKPVSEKEFHKTISAILEEISVQEKIIQERNALENYTRNSILNQLVNGADYDQLKKRYAEFDFSYIDACHRLFLIGLDQDIFSGTVERKINECSADWLQQLLPDGSYFTSLNPIQHLIFFEGQEHLFSWYQSRADKLAGQLRQIFKVNCHVMISDFFSGPNELVLAYKDAERCLYESFFDNDTVLINQVSFVSANDTILKDIQMDIQVNNAESLKKHVKAMIGDWHRQQNPSMICFHFFCINVLKLLLDGLQWDTEETFKQYFKSISSTNSLLQVEDILLRLTEALVEKWEIEQNTSKYVIQIVKQYIHDHYGDDLSLDVLAKNCNLTPVYLSTIFSKENGCSISKYVIKVRMEKAQWLLMNTNMRVTEIMQQVGYTNLSYFCKCFAKTFGLSLIHI